MWHKKTKVAISNSATKPAQQAATPTAKSSKPASTRIKDFTDQYEGEAFQIIGAKKP